MELKGAKTQTELAKAKNLEAMADKTNLDYIHEYNRTKVKEDMQRQAMQNQFDVDRETLKLIQGAKRDYI